VNPGRELDALVAEKIFGMTFDVGNGPCPMTQFVHYVEQQFDVAKTNSGVELHTLLLKKEKLLMQIPHYSTDISAAWEVVEKTKLLENYAMGIFQGEWTIAEEFSCVVQGIIAQAATAPYAICLAALKLCGEKLEQK